MNEPLEGETLEEGGEAQFAVTLRRTNKSNSQVVGISNFPKYKEASWFLIIANSVTGQLLCLKRVAFKRFTQKNLVVLLPEDFEREKYLKIYLMCDSYIGLDQEYTVDLLKVNQILASNKAQVSKKKTGKSDKIDDATGPVTINAKPPVAKTMMINTGASFAEDDEDKAMDRTVADE